MKQKLLFIFALLCAVAQGAWSENVVNLSSVTSAYTAQDGDVLTGQLYIYVKISIADKANVTLRDAKIIGSDDDDFYSNYTYPFAGITCEGDATITLEGDNEVCGNGRTYPGIQPGPTGKTLTIKGSGSLIARSHGLSTGIGCCSGGSCGNIVIEGGNITARGSNRHGAGIGASDEGSCCGDITIKGGYITAVGGGGCAGIGRGYLESSCGTITITGGEIHATGNTATDSDGNFDGSGAGIGRGKIADGGDIYIYNGTVYAKGGSQSAGIGGGAGGYGGTIWIEGGTIVATGGDRAAGIGGGSGATGGDIFIYGGDITAYGGKYGAGIGGGIRNGGGAIWITGGTVKAYGGTDAAGIGGGEDGGSGSIVINGGDVYASGDGYGVGIGAGEDGDVDNTISINGGTVEAFGGDDINRAIGGEDDEDYSNISIDSKMKVTDASTFGSTLSYAIRGLFLSSYYHLKFEPCDHAGQTLSYAYVDNEKHKFVCQWCGWHEEEHTDQLSCNKCNYEGTPQHAHYYEMVYNEQKQKYEYQEVATETFKTGLILPELKSPLPTERVFVGWVGGAPDAEDDGILKEASYYLWPSGQYVSTDAEEANFKARYVNKTLDLATVQSDQKIYDGMILTGTLNTASYPVKITIANNATVTLSGATINGVNNSNYSWAGINCEGNATIILEGENTVKGFYEDYPGVWVLSDGSGGYSLTIKGTGSLNASSNGFGAGIGSAYGSDIQGAGNIFIQGGNITATGGTYAAGIGSNWNNSCGLIMITGGTINATGGAAGIGSGWGDPNNSSYFSNCGTISISDNVTSVTATKGEYSANSIGAGYAGTCTSVVIGSKAGAVTQSPYNYVPLADASNNSSKISNFSNEVCDVTLKGRTLYKDGDWNTLCLPFSIDNFSGTPLEGATVKTLTSANFDSSDGTLTLNFTENTETEIVAGTPYIVKWASGDDIKNPMFSGVTITATTPNDITPTGGTGSDGSVSFKGTFNPVAIGEDGDNTKLYLGSGNKLYWPSKAMSINAFRAYFQLNSDQASNARAFVLNFDGGEQTGITTTDYTNFTNSDSAWYDLSGRKLSGKPTTKGLYINNGKKVVIK